MKFTQDGRDVIKLPGLRRHGSCSILYSLELMLMSITRNNEQKVSQNIYV